MYPNSLIRQRIGNELKVVYCGQDSSMYDELKLGLASLHSTTLHGNVVSNQMVRVSNCRRFSEAVSWLEIVVTDS